MHGHAICPPMIVEGQPPLITRALSRFHNGSITVPMCIPCASPSAVASLREKFAGRQGAYS